jgi:hypothetical protein
VPDAPERIFQQWEAESAHRRAYEKKALNGTIAKDRRGQWAAISFALSALGLAGFSVWMGQPWLPAFLAAAPSRPSSAHSYTSATAISQNPGRFASFEP